jgi:hypothetical protein
VQVLGGSARYAAAATGAPSNSDYVRYILSEKLLNRFHLRLGRYAKPIRPLVAGLLLSI